MQALPVQHRVLRRAHRHRGRRFDVDNLKRARRRGRGSPPCRRSPPSPKPTKRAISASSMVSSLVSSLGPGLVALLHPHAVDRVQAVVGDAQPRALLPDAHRTMLGSACHGRVQLPAELAHVADAQRAQRHVPRPLISRPLSQRKRSLPRSARSGNSAAPRERGPLTTSTPRSSVTFAIADRFVRPADVWVSRS